MSELRKELEEITARSLRPVNKDGKILVPAVSAKALQEMALPKTRWLVEGTLPQGAAVLSAASKVGKSWLALDLGLSVATGRQFLGHQTVQSGVLYMALEDSYSRLQERLKKMLAGAPAPEGLELVTTFADMDNGFDEMLRDYLHKGREEVKLVIVDTLQKVRGPGVRGESLYAQDYRQMGSLKALADELQICLLFIHHNRKMPDETDPFNLISGSTGIMGVADTVWVITKEKRNGERATLHVTGRDVLQESTVIEFDRESFRWRALGDKESLELQKRETAWRRNLLGAAVKLVTLGARGHWEGTASDLIKEFHFYSAKGVPDNPKTLSTQLRGIKEDLAEFESIVYATETGSAHRTVHKFFTESFLIEAYGKKVEEEEDRLWNFS